MGTYSKKVNTTFNTLRDNLPSTKTNYPINNGYFGEIGKSNVRNIREIKTTDILKEAKKFYNSISYNGIEKNFQITMDI